MSDDPNQLALFSNRGRVALPGVLPAQRRVKPDSVAPGTNILSTRPVALPPFPAGSPALPTTAPPPFYLHRGSDNALRLGRHDANLNLVNGFGTNGVATLAPASRPKMFASRPSACTVITWQSSGTHSAATI